MSQTQRVVFIVIYIAWSVCHRSGVMDFWYRFKLDFSFYGSDTPNLSHLNEVQVIYEETFAPNINPVSIKIHKYFSDMHMRIYANQSRSNLFEKLI